MSQNISSEQIEITQEFVNECQDLLEQLEPTVVELGHHAGDGALVLSEERRQEVNAIFRLFHSIKGSAGFLNFGFMVKTAHAAENLLDRIRSGAIRMTIEHVNLLCQTCDFTKAALDYVAANFNDAGMEQAALELTARLKATSGTKTPAPTPTPAAIKTEPAVPKVMPEASLSPGEEPEISLELLITPEMVERFVQEADEQLQEVEQGLLLWGKTPDDISPVAGIFRLVHSFKGNCGFLGYGDLERLSHQMETVLAAVKSGVDLGRAKPAEALLNLLDVLKGAVAAISKKESASIDGLDLYLQLLVDLLPRQEGAKSSPEKPPPPRLGQILVAQGAVTREDVEAALAVQRQPLGEILVNMGAARPEHITEALNTQAAEAGAPARPSSGETAMAAAAIKRQDIRVDLDKLDILINLIGEMVIAENMLIHSPDIDGLELENFSKSAQQMNKIVKELQEVAMTIRMIPVAGLFRRMTRLVHDLSAKCGKKVDLQLFGLETELDKTVIETITDPLVHLIRNSLDHGLEPREERLQHGKSETGVVRLSANHEEGEVWITVEDDGRGLNREKILQKAISRNLIEGDGAQLSDREVAALTFLPGFSTAEKVTDVSGRGVGMDVVKQNLAKINGKIDVTSRPSQGTKTILRIPLTMAIIDGMLVRVGNAKFIVPILSIKESFRPDPKAITVSPDGQELVRVRDRLQPVLRLHALHDIPPDRHGLHEGILIVLESQGTCLSLFVDEILGQQQTVIKGLSDYIGRHGKVQGVSGCTILGNGEICLILDANALAEALAKGVVDA